MSTATLQTACVEKPYRGRHLAVMLKPRSTRRFYLKEWRLKRGLTQEQLAEKAGMTYSNVSSIELGRSGYTEATLQKFAKALDCDPVDLITRAPDDEPDLWALWANAQPGQRRRFQRLARALLQDGDDE